jgi:hypothetical protein
MLEVSISAETKPLVKDEDGVAAVEGFSYSSVVGMLLYLSGHTRPDITYVINCCARYMFCPKHSHELALKRIGRYLKNTSSRGMVINPTRELSIDAYPDADFAGMYGYEKPTDPACAKSRTGFVIVFAGVPVLWQSKLQTETALSTMEAEIIALAACMRELIPIIDIVQSLADAVGIPAGDVNMRVSVHEYNSGALVLAETLPPQFTPRSKYYATKTIWFCEEIRKRGIKLLKMILLSSLGISSPRNFLSPRLNTLDPKLLVGNYAFLFGYCICPVFKYNLERECRHRSSALCRHSQCFLLHRGQGVLTVLQHDDHHCDIQSLSLARMCGE